MALEDDPPLAPLANITKSKAFEIELIPTARVGAAAEEVSAKQYHPGGGVVLTGAPETEGAAMPAVVRIALPAVGPRWTTKGTLEAPAEHPGPYMPKS